MFDQIERKENSRTLYQGKSKFVIEAEDPYGFWKIRFIYGKVPAKLNGYYTSVDEAEKALVNYLSTNKPDQKVEKNSVAA